MTALGSNITALAYLVAAVLFILSLRGLSSPESSRQGNFFGMLGMAIAIVATVLNPEIVSYEWIIAGIVIGGVIGVIIAKRIAMTAMPQLVAAFHSLVGLAAVLVAAAAFYNPEAYDIVYGPLHAKAGEIFLASRIEMALG